MGVVTRESGRKEAVHSIRALKGVQEFPSGQDTGGEGQLKLMPHKQYVNR